MTRLPHGPSFCKPFVPIFVQVRFLVFWFVSGIWGLLIVLGTPLPAQKSLAHCIETGLFVSLKQQHKIVLCEALLDVGCQDLSAVSPISAYLLALLLLTDFMMQSSLARQVLSTTLIDVPLIVHLLGLLSPAGSSISPRASKRAKTTE